MSVSEERSWLSSLALPPFWFLGAIVFGFVAFEYLGGLLQVTVPASIVGLLLGGLIDLSRIKGFLHRLPYWLRGGAFGLFIVLTVGVYVFSCAYLKGIVAPSSWGFECIIPILPLYAWVGYLPNYIPSWIPPHLVLVGTIFMPVFLGMFIGILIGFLKRDNRK